MLGCVWGECVARSPRADTAGNGHTDIQPRTWRRSLLDNGFLLLLVTGVMRFSLALTGPEVYFIVPQLNITLCQRTNDLLML